MHITEHRERTAARLAAVQALYQMEASGTGADSVILEFSTHRLGGDIEGAAIHDADRDFFAEIVRGVVEHQRRIDPYIARQLAKNWALARLDSTVRAILRAGLYELMQRPEVPFRVVIDEYVELARAFFDDGEEPAFVNAVLNAASREARGDEIDEE